MNLVIIRKTFTSQTTRNRLRSLYRRYNIISGWGDKSRGGSMNVSLQRDTSRRHFKRVRCWIFYSARSLFLTVRPNHRYCKNGRLIFWQPSRHARCRCSIEYQIILRYKSNLSSRICTRIAIYSGSFCLFAVNLLFSFWSK